MSRNNLIEGKQKLLRVIGRFELSRVRVTELHYSKCMKEIQEKSTLVRVSEGSSYRESTVSCSRVPLKGLCHGNPVHFV